MKASSWHYQYNKRPHPGASLSLHLKGIADGVGAAVGEPGAHPDVPGGAVALFVVVLAVDHIAPDALDALLPLDELVALLAVPWHLHPSFPG